MDGQHHSGVASLSNGGVYSGVPRNPHDGDHGNDGLPPRSSAKPARQDHCARDAHGDSGTNIMPALSKGRLAELHQMISVVGSTSLFSLFSVNFNVAERVGRRQHRTTNLSTAMSPPSAGSTNMLTSPTRRRHVTQNLVIKINPPLSIATSCSERDGGDELPSGHHRPRRARPFANFREHQPATGLLPSAVTPLRRRRIHHNANAARGGTVHRERHRHRHD